MNALKKVKFCGIVRDLLNEFKSGDILFSIKLLKYFLNGKLCPVVFE